MIVKKPRSLKYYLVVLTHSIASLTVKGSLTMDGIVSLRAALVSP
jgi:hypothetical protein